MNKRVACILLAAALMLSACSENAGNKEESRADMEPSEIFEDVQVQAASVELDGDEDEPEPDEIFSGRHVIAQSLTPDGEEFLFAFDYIQASDQHFDVLINITNDDGFHQQLNFEAYTSFALTAYPAALVEDVIPGWYVTDFNFDGYRDLLCVYDLTYDGRICYRGWLWNPDARLFEEASFECSDNLAIDRHLELIKCYDRYKSYIYHGDRVVTYKLQAYTSEGFVVTNQLEVTYVNYREYIGTESVPAEGKDYREEDWLPHRGFHYEEYRLVGGEMVLVSEAFEAESGDLPERYCGEDSIWFYDGTRGSFYVSAGSRLQTSPGLSPMDVG